MASLDELKRRVAAEFGTPAVVIDLDKVDRNNARVQAWCDKAGVANRPHIKTHKSPVLALKQIEGGAKGVTCQKLGEAEVMADAGIGDILVSYNLIGEARANRLGALLRKAPDVKVCCDNPVTLETYREAARQAGQPLGVVVECDTGRKRAGVETPREAPDRIDLRVEDQPRDRRARVLHGPANPRGFVLTGVREDPWGLLGVRVANLGFEASPRNHHLACPRAREGPPSHIEQEALPEPVVPGDEIQPRRKVERHLGRRTDVLEVKGLEHG